ncbi:Dyp-type peroxidase domain-containing protein, partial [Streptomyces sp. NPDC002156]
MSVPEPQPVPQSVLSPLTNSAVFLVVTVDPGGEPVVRELLSDLSGLVRAVGFRIPEGELTCVAGIGSEAWGPRLNGARAGAREDLRGEGRKVEGGGWTKCFYESVVRGGG